MLITSRHETLRWPNVILILYHRLRRWPNIKTTLGEHLVFAGIACGTLQSMIPIHVFYQLPVNDVTCSMADCLTIWRSQLGFKLKLESEALNILYWSVPSELYTSCPSIRIQGQAPSPVSNHCDIMSLVNTMYQAQSSFTHMYHYSHVSNC